MFRKMIMAALVAATIVGAVPQVASAQQLPKRDAFSISNAAAYTETVPALENGTLDVVKIWNCNPTNATLTVKQVYRAAGFQVTNTLATITGAIGTGNGSATISNAYVIPGDLLLYQFSAAATGTVDRVRRIGN